MPKTLSINFVHLVWSTKNREPLIPRSIRPELNSFIKLSGIKQGYSVDTVNGMDDHIHVLLKLKPTQSISVVVKWIKGASSRWLNKNYPNVDSNFKWQEGYGVFSVSPYDVNRLRKYIFDQELHHKKIDYRTELKTLESVLRRN